MNNKEIAASFFEMVTTGRVAEAYEQFIGPSFRHHNAFFEGTPEALQAGMEENARQSPNKVFEIKQIIAEGDRVVTHSLLKQKPDDIGLVVVHIVRIENGKIVEMWDLGQPIPAESINKNGTF